MTEDSKKVLPTDVPPAPVAPVAPDIPEQTHEHSPISFAGQNGTGAIHLDASSAADSASPPASPPTTPIVDNSPITLAPLEIPDSLKKKGTVPPRGGAFAKGSTTSSASGGTGSAGTTDAAVKADLPPVTAGPAEHSFRLLGFVSLLSLALILALQQAASVYFPTLFTPSELNTATVYENMLASGQWLVPPFAEGLLPSLPAYFWFVRLVDALPLVDASYYLYPLVSALSALVALGGTYALGCAAGFGNRVSFAAGLILLSSLAFGVMGHFLSFDLFFAGLLALALACLYRGWVSRLSYVWLALGFALIGIATLTGGLIGLVIPLLTSLVFVIWRGSFRRAHQLDAVFGFALLLIILLGWLGAIILLTGENTYLYTLTRQIALPFLLPLWPPHDPWWLYAARLPAGLLPWVLVLLFVPWGRVCGGAWTTLKASRAPLPSESTGAAWIWTAFVIGFAYLTITSNKPCLAFTSLLPLAALLLAKALLHLPQPNSRGLFLLLSVLFALAALIASALSLPFAQSALNAQLPEAALKALETVEGLPVMAAVCAFAALVLWKFTRRSLPAGALLVTVLLATMLVQPAVLLLAPSLEGLMGSTQETRQAPQAIPPASLQHLIDPAKSADPANPAIESKQPQSPSATESPSAAPEATEPSAVPEVEAESLPPAVPAPVIPPHGDIRDKDAAAEQAADPAAAIPDAMQTAPKADQPADEPRLTPPVPAPAPPPANNQ